jgi:hypothetical protein
MSDDLVKRLRLIGEKRLQCTACYSFIDTADEAADRIEHLENRCANLLVGNRALNIRSDKLEGALIDILKVPRSEASWGIALVIAHHALKEGKDD